MIWNTSPTRARLDRCTTACLSLLATALTAYWRGIREPLYLVAEEQEDFWLSWAVMWG